MDAEREKGVLRSKLCLVVTTVVRHECAAHENPAADPLPGPTEIPLFLAQLTKSATIRKYASYPFLIITESSVATLSLISAVIVSYLLFSPLLTNCFKYSAGVNFLGTS